MSAREQGRSTAKPLSKQSRKTPVHLAVAPRSDVLRRRKEEREEEKAKAIRTLM
ncbi:unnamed protein product [Dovyalis caffra]|uniref:Uncharacterized protein n=1 Tax=Dovyalis caffra TaxID=77055 RepID=A0AAV1SC72_9ROSI|nr:unnamed protein product [Dovyalis caffra]